MKMVENTLGFDESEISKEKITGHFGNEIISVKVHVIGPTAQILAGRIVGSLSQSARVSIREGIEKSLDEHDSLYLRLDRQTLEDPSLSLSDEEPIRIKLKPKSRSGGRESMKIQYEELVG